jgi:hypothetical protein
MVTVATVQTAHGESGSALGARASTVRITKAKILETQKCSPDFLSPWADGGVTGDREARHPQGRHGLFT